jgi:hypothetical protein
MKRESPLRAIQRKLYLVAVPIFLAVHPRCQCGCGRKANQVHHKAGREGWLLCWIKYWMPVCSRCHAWITAHGRESSARGWKVEVPVTTRSQRAKIEMEIRAYINKAKSLAKTIVVMLAFAVAASAHAGTEDNLQTLKGGFLRAMTDEGFELITETHYQMTFERRQDIIRSNYYDPLVTLTVIPDGDNYKIRWRVYGVLRKDTL